ncbi:MAG: N-acetylglucosamine-6-phosphate deacetylase [Bacteroidales bacterium]|nr:N-acetylglucosamine-6-phosphate deacetylase [Bacteroidales bacterium]
MTSFADQPSEQTIKGLFYRDCEPVEIKIADGRIAKIRHLPGEEVDTEESDTYVAPGLVEVQINGYMGVDFSGEDLTLDGVREATRELWKAGITTYLPTLISQSHERLKGNFTILSQAMDDSEIGASIAGFHLEGPYISPEEGFRGAHLKKYIRKPDWEEFMEYQQAADNGIKLVAVAPEVEGAIPFVRRCVESGVEVTLAHHNGSAEEIKEAVDAGASMSNHLGNGCANMIHRHNNPLWPQMADDRLTPSIIADGYHLTREEVRTFYKVKGADNLILVSDALDLAGLPPGKYERGGRTLQLTENVVKFPDQNVLAGAASPISKCVSNMLEFTRCSLKDAIQMASTNPARQFDLDEIGEISQGKRADLILFTMEEGEMIIQKTIVAGKVVYSKE